MSFIYSLGRIGLSVDIKRLQEHVQWILPHNRQISLLDAMSDREKYQKFAQIEVPGVSELSEGNDRRLHWRWMHIRAVVESLYVS